MRRRLVSGLLALLTVAVVATVLLLPSFAQPLEYHRFADDRAWLGVPNFFDVVSNAPFLLVAVLGLRVLIRPGAGAFAAPFDRVPYALVFLALAATSLGSAWYHLAPDNARLVWDRLPMSVAFAALVAAVIAERWNVRVGLWLLVPLVAVGAGTVLWWRISVVFGGENVLPYFAFQGWALLAVLLMLCLPSRRADGTYLLAALVLYGFALGAEWLDGVVFSWGELVSGHTLKHLLAALAAYQVVRMLRRFAGSGGWG